MNVREMNTYGLRRKLLWNTVFAHNHQAPSAHLDVP
jgi:hypothetical protein